ncbi:hypothetical protein Clacol_009207 [Clathrus columnatus]|uniref:Autophagy-related protein 11 n=1 Tax=Clathrus columnatus TaxID=1419009 RepID=A0AAV5AMI8_9AGAM|nr:hypothetical protein Clacol_009207 [Clathrus columnatus]
MHIYRAEDGELFQVNKTLQDIERHANLNNFLHNITSVDEEAVLAYLPDGRRLKDDNLRELAGVPDQASRLCNINLPSSFPMLFRLYLHCLDYELEEVLLKLRVEPLLQTEIPIEYENLDKVASIAIKHYDTIIHLANSVRVQHDALRIASTSLDLHVLSISNVFETLAASARRELEKQSVLLHGLEFDLDIISKIRIHSDFLSPAVRRAVEAGEKARTLGDYVSNVKMRQVGEACGRIHSELRKRFGTAEDGIARLSAGANDVRSSFVNSGLVCETELCSKRAQEALEQIDVVKTKGRGENGRANEPELLSDLRQLDKLLRDEVHLISEIKNKSTALCIRSLRHISQLNNDLVSLPNMLSNLQADFRVKTTFTHIERLHKMLYAYGATLVEIVRRKEFSRFFSQRAQMIAEVMAKLSASERKQRQIYRGEVLGQLPFDLKNMDDPVPAMEVTSTGTTIGNYTIERTDLMMLLEEIDKMEQSQIGDPNENFNVNALSETRSRLEKLIIRMDGLEITFDKIAEKTIFSASRLLLPSRQTSEHTDSEFQELVDQFHDLQDAKTEQERQFEDERHGLQGELDQLQAELREAHAHAAREGHLVTDLEDQLVQLQHRHEEMTHKLHETESREKRLLARLEEQRTSVDDAEETRMAHVKIVEQLRQELLLSRNEAQHNKKLEMESSSKLMQVLSTKELISRELEEAIARENQLMEENFKAREEIESLKKQLSQGAEDSEEKLRAQALESDRALRDVIAEADGDRAVLEHQCFELAAKLQRLEQEYEGSQTKEEASRANISGMQEEIQNMSKELDAARQVEQRLRRELNDAKEDLVSFKVRLTRSEQTSKDLLHVATSFRDAQCKAYAAAAQSLTSSSKSTANLADSVVLSKPTTESTPIDTDDIGGALRVLSEFDTNSLVDAVSKLGTIIRKWQKQCKEYRDRAKGKITFRNFAKGDLALFLPTRNSVSKPWAAFNVSFPHYFLSVNKHLAEQLKTREWIVARITSITEQIVNVRDPSTNPYGLSDGIKFYMLQVEDWTQSNSRRKSSPPKSGSETVESHVNAQIDTFNHASSGAVVDADVDPTSLPSPPSQTIEVNSQENTTPFSSNLLENHQRTIPVPVSHDSPSSSPLTRLFVQDTVTSPIEEAVERTSPSPPRAVTPPVAASLVRRSSSPLARVISRVSSPVSGATFTAPAVVHSPSPLRSSTSPSPNSLPNPGTSSESPLRIDVPDIPSESPTSSPHRRSSSLARASSLVSPSKPRHSSPIFSSFPRSRPSSPLASPAHVHAHVISNSPSAARTSLPSPLITSVSLAETSGTAPPVTSAVVESSPVLSVPAQSGSRRSSSSSKPSISSLFSAGRSPLTMTAVGNGSAPKAVATTALSNAVTRQTSLSVHTNQSIQEFPHHQRGDNSVGSSDSLERGMSNLNESSSSLLDRRRTNSTSTTRDSNSRRERTSRGKGVQHSRTMTNHEDRQGSVTGFAGWNFGRRNKKSAGDPEGTESDTSGNANARRGASDILKRYDDILPQERGSR